MSRYFCDFSFESSLDFISNIFSLAGVFKNNFRSHGSFVPKNELLQDKTVALVFLEPSTRTKMSFELAAHRLGIKTSVFHAKTSSLNKKESILETLKNLDALNYDLIVLRHSEFLTKDIMGSLNTPIISGGLGAISHPTQVLLDLFTLFNVFSETNFSHDFMGIRSNQSIESLPKNCLITPQEISKIFKHKKILFIGDSLRSRIFHSYLSLLSCMDFKIGIYSPSSLEEFQKSPFVNKEISHSIQEFSDYSKALKWADIAYVLRLQQERQELKDQDIQDYTKTFKFGLPELSQMRENIVFMHPGPFVEGVDMDAQVLKDSRCLMYEQVSHGVFVRAALLSYFFWETKDSINF